MLQLLAEGEDHRLRRQPGGDHDRRPKFVVKVGAAKASEAVTPEVDADTLGAIDSAHVGPEDARRCGVVLRPDIARACLQFLVVAVAAHYVPFRFRPGFLRSPSPYNPRT